MIIFFTKGTKSAGSSRHRAFNLADFLTEAGIPCRVIIPPVFIAKKSRIKSKIQYLESIFSASSRDTIVLQSTIFNLLFISLISLTKFIRRPQIIFDFDDALYLHNPKITKYLVWLADKVTVASHELKDWVEKRGKLVLVVPNLIDYKIAEAYIVDYKIKKEVVLGWIGGAPSSIPNLLLLVPVFEELRRRNFNFKFKLIGTLNSKAVTEIFNISGVKSELIDRIEWTKKGVIQQANQSFDIGLAPLVDWPVNRARCSLKVLDYMSVGLPVVCSDVGENRHFVENNVSGFLVHSTSEWVQRLGQLISDNSLRERIGTKARERAKKFFSYQSKIDKYKDFILNR